MRNLINTLCFGGALALTTACGSAAPASPAPTPAPSPEPEAALAPSPEVLAAAARADSVRRSFNEADVAFMTHMIRHHAQALLMARMAPTHDASPAIRTLADRIINSQLDEIALMERWLRERDRPVPVVTVDGTVEMPAAGGHGAAADHAHAAHDEVPMAGMLTPEQLRRLESARGADWDRLFLTYMIQHHQGATVMVDELFATPGAGQGDAIFKIAADIGADQASEIDRMQRMLRDLVVQSGNRS